MIFQCWGHFSSGDISVLSTFQFWWHFSFGDISVWRHFRFAEMSLLVTWASSKACVTLLSSPRCKQPTNTYSNIKPIQILLVGLIGIRQSGDRQYFSCWPVGLISNCNPIPKVLAGMHWFILPCSCQPNIVFLKGIPWWKRHHIWVKRPKHMKIICIFTLLVWSL